MEKLAYASLPCAILQIATRPTLNGPSFVRPLPVTSEHLLIRLSHLPCSVVCLSGLADRFEHSHTVWIDGDIVLPSVHVDWQI